MSGQRIIEGLEEALEHAKARPVAWIDPETIRALKERERWTTAILRPTAGEGASMPLYARPAPVAVETKPVSEGCGYPCGYDCNGACFAQFTAYRPMDEAPKDGSMLRLFCLFDGDSSVGAFEDADTGWTIGTNNLSNTGDDLWEIVGWDWEQDTFRQAHTAKPLGWLPFHAAPEAPQPLLDAPTFPLGSAHQINHDGFRGVVIGHYETLEGKRGVVLQQQGTRVVHVYGEKWLIAAQETKPLLDAPRVTDDVIWAAHDKIWDTRSAMQFSAAKEAVEAALEAMQTKPVADTVKWADVRDFIIHRADQLRGQYPRQIFWALADDMSNKLRGVSASEDASPQPLLDAPRVSDEMVERAVDGYDVEGIGRPESNSADHRLRLRAALEAALSALQSDGEGE